jgi:predicted MFS family arabinose efflux permease
MRRSEATADHISWRVVVAGLCANLVGIGLARFAYTPLIPALVAAKWFLPAQADYLGAANLAGYLAGALLARPMAARMADAILLRAMMLLATATFFACAAPLSFLWFFVWRFAAGLAGGAIMVLAAPAALAHVPPSRRGLVGGILFAGVGLGIAASGTLVPLLLRAGLPATWCGLGVLAAMLSVVAWGGWQSEWPRAAPPGGGHANGWRRRPRPPAMLAALYLQYALNAVGLVPYMVFLVDFVARELGRGIASGARIWVIYGIGALIGPVLTGRLADGVGFDRALRLTYVVQAVAVIVPAMTTGAAALAVSGLVIGASTPGIVPLVFGRIHELAPADDRSGAWRTATLAFAIGQAGAAYGFAAIFAGTGDYILLFVIAAGAFALALGADLAVAAATRFRYRQSGPSQRRTGG